MKFYKTILGLLHTVYRKDTFVNALIQSIGDYLDKIYFQIISIKNNFFFDLLDEEGCKWWEGLVDIEPTTILSDRRARIKAKWNSNNHNCIDLIQNCCNAWKNGEVFADFMDGKIHIKFVGQYGRPDFLELLKSSIEEIKPAHLGYFFEFKYLLIEDIHIVKTVEEMQEISINQFLIGVE